MPEGIRHAVTHRVTVTLAVNAGADPPPNDHDELMRALAGAFADTLDRTVGCDGTDGIVRGIERVERIAGPDDIPTRELAFDLPMIDSDTGGMVGTVGCRVVAGAGGLEVFPDGYGVADMRPGRGSPIHLEHHGGGLRLSVWGDINHEDPTDDIDLEPAREDRRED